MSFFKDKELYLFLFFFLLILLYLNINFIVYIFLIPLFFYLKQTKKLNLELTIFLIILSSIINFIYLHGYGFKFMIIVIIANLIFFIPFIILSKILIKKKYYILSISCLFFLLFYLLQFTILNNFWINLSSFLFILPFSIQILGSFITTFLIITFNLILFQILYNYVNKIKIKKTLLFIFLIFIINFSIPILNSYENNPSIKVAGIQGNLDQDWFERKEKKDLNFQTYSNLTSQAISQYNPEIVIWPEYTFTHLFEFDFLLQEKINSIATSNNITLIVGSIKLDPKDNLSSNRFNTLYIFKDNQIQTYNAFEPVTIFDKEVIKATSNTKLNLNSGLFLCYEENFPYLYRNKINEESSELLFTIGNQYYIKNKQGLEISSLNSNLRAAENNRYLFRLETAGYSIIINNKGQNIQEVPINSKQILYGEIPLISNKTIYTRYGNIFEIILFIFSIIILIFTLKYNKN